jgi:hypothetical protein
MMSTMAATQLITDTDVFQSVGLISEVDDKEIIVENDSGRFHVGVATSCLVEPEQGDEVLFSGRKDGELYILAILRRPSNTPLRLRSEGDLTIVVNQGRFTVASRDGVELVSSQDISMTSKGVQIRATEGHVFFDKLTYLGRKVLAEAEQAKTVIGFFDSVLDRFTQRVKSSYRFVDLVDQVRAKQVDYAAKENLRLRGNNALVNADLLIKIDGDQIHLG